LVPNYQLLAVVPVVHSTVAEVVAAVVLLVLVGLLLRPTAVTVAVRVVLGLHLRIVRTFPLVMLLVVAVVG